MLEIGSIDLSKIFKTSSIGTNGQTQQPQKEEFEKALFSFGTQNKDFSDNDMKKLEEEFLSAANTAGKTNPFEKKNSSTDSLEREKEQKIDEIKRVEEEVNTLVEETQTLSSNIFANQNSMQSGIKIGQNNESNSSITFGNSNILNQHNEAINKKELSNQKNQELGSLIKEAESLDIEIVTKSTCGQQGEMPNLKEVSDNTKANEARKNETEKEEAKEPKKTPQEIILEQVDLLARLFPDMENKPNDVDSYKETHQRNMMDLEAVIQILKKQAENLPSVNQNSTYIQRQKALFLGLTS